MQMFAVAAVWAALLLAGCGQGDELARLNSAKQQLAQGQARSAAVTLAALVQARPDSAELRLLLGRALMASGDAAGAEPNFRRALSAGTEVGEAAPLLATAMIAQGRAEAMLSEFSRRELGDDNDSAELASLMALALASLGRFDAAQETVAAQLRRTPHHVAVAIMQARIAVAIGDVKGATEQSAKLVAREPRHPQVLALAGDLAQARGDVPAAIAAYRQALAIDPRIVAAHSGMITHFVRSNELSEASAHLEAMRKALPGKAETLYFEAVVAQLKGDARQARDLTQTLLRANPNSPQLLLLASMAELQLGSPAAAERFLEKAISLEPNLPELRRQLARVHLQAGRPDRALDTLRTLIQSKSDDAEALTLAAQAHLVAGDIRQSEQFFGRASALRPGDPEVRAALGRAYLARGQVEPGLRELQAAASADPRGGDADLALISARMRRSEFDAAARALDALAAKQPTQALPEHLRGHLALLRRDPTGARQHFERAVERDPGYFPSVTRLAELDMAENQQQRARSRHEALLNRHPDHVGAMFALATVARRSGAPPAEAAAWLDKAVKVRPKDLATWTAAVDHQLQAGDAQSALTLAKAALQALPDRLELIERLGLAQVAAGDPQAGLETLAKLQKSMPTSARLLLLMADASLAAGDAATAQLHVQSALALAPESEVVQRRGAAMAMKRGRTDDAIGIAREVQAREPAQALGWRLEGDAEAMRKNWDAAAAAFRHALGKKNVGDTPVRLHWALANSSKPAEATRFEQTWLKDHPGDVRFLMHLGERALLQSDFAAAEARFRRVVELQPEHPYALNNLAYLLAQAGKPGALALAERASRVAPGQPEILDTLAMVLAKEGQAAQAIAWQKRALALAPGSGGLRLNLARLYVQAGDRDQARRELEQLAKLGPAFSAHEEVQRMLKAL